MRQAALTLAIRLFAVMVGLLSSIATARYLGPAGRGVFFFWTSVAAVIVQFGNFGLHASNTYLHARKGVDPAVLSANSLVAALAAGPVLAVLAVLGLRWVGHVQVQDPLLMAALALLAVAGLYGLLGSNLLVAMGRLTEFNLLELSTRIVTLVVLLAVVATWPDPVKLLMATGLAALVMAAIMLWRLLRVAPMKRPDWNVFRSGIAYGLRAYVVAALGAMTVRLNAFLLQPAIPSADYGAWSIAAQIFDVMSLVPASIALVLLPKVMRSDSPRALVRANALASGGIMLVLLLPLVLVGRPLIVLLYGPAFEPAFSYLLWGAPGLLALAIISILSQYLATVGLPRALIGLWLVVAMLHGAIAVSLIPRFGAAGAMASQSIAYIIGLLLMYILIRHLKGQHA